MLFRRSLGHVPALAALLALAAIPSASAQSFTITFENATNIPNNASPNNTANSSINFKSAFGSDTLNGGLGTISNVTFDDTFIVYRSNYTNGVGGTDTYAATHGTFGLANTSGVYNADTGPDFPGIDGLVLTTQSTLTSAYFGSVDYGNGSTGATQVTVTAVGSSGDLTAVTVTGLTSTALTKMDTSAFLAYAGQINSYRINRDAGQYGSLGSGGNYVIDDLTFTTAPEPSAPASFGLGALTLLGWVAVRRRIGGAKDRAAKAGA